MKQYYLLIFVFVISISSNAQNGFSKEDREAIALAKKKEQEALASAWQKKLKDFHASDIYSLRAELDTSITINNSYPIKFHQLKFIDLYPINQLIERYICLPKIESDSIEIKFTCRSKNLLNSYLIINTIDSLEHLIKVDTINTLTNNKWVTFKHKINKKNVSFLDLIIRMKGNPQNNQVQNFWVDKLEILDNKESIDNKSTFSNPIPDIKKEDYISLNSLNPDFNKLEDLKKHKIIALGESIHGSKSINQLSINIIKHQIINNNCKLVLLEIPLEMSLFINKYINGNENIKLETIKEILHGINLSTTGFLEFFSWLKDYNYNHKDNEILVLGTDLYLFPNLVIKNLIKYTNTAYDINKNPILEKLVGNLKGTHRGEIPLTTTSGLDFIKKLKNTLSYLHKYKTYITSKIGKKEYLLLEYCLKYNIDMEGFLDFIGRVRIRDFRMYCNVEFLINNIMNTEKQFSIVIYSHEMHVNKISFVYNSWRNISMGKFLDNKYKEDYFVIGVLAAKGNIYDIFDKNQHVKEVKEPEENTIEKMFLDKKEKLVYFDISKLKASPIKMRVISVPYSDIQFFNISPQSRVDAMLFLEDSKALIK